MKTEPQKNADLLRVLEHELRNPLATILTTIELVNALGAGAKDAPKLLRVVAEKVRIMSKVLDKRFDQARPKSRNAVRQTMVPRISAINTKTSTLKKSPRILIVDDNVTAADSLGQLLVMRGYDVAVAHSGVQALVYAAAFHPQVAILDLEMPDMDGYELLGLLRLKKLHCAFVALTGYGHVSDKAKVLKAGFGFHLTKPAAIKNIEAVIKKVVSKKKNGS